MSDAVGTVCAVATPPGRGGVGIVRLSGPRAGAIAEAVAGTLPAPRQAAFRRFRDATGEILDEGLVLYFPGPASFTGEDVVELQGHGGPIVLDRVVAALRAAGAEPARPGEFSERAFLNGRLDLAQAEAIADLIDAQSDDGARAAVRSLEGALSHRVNALVDAVTELRVFIEAGIDFSDEELDLLADDRVRDRLADLEARVGATLAEASRGRLLRDGMRLVIAGRPNAGKSSLLNRLAGAESAIVTDVPGTTRDVLREHLHIDGLPLHVIDTAGLRDSDDPVEREGVRRAWREIEDADRVLLVVDDRDGVTNEDEAILARLPSTLPRTIVHNKADLTRRPTGLDGHGTLAVSALTGDGLDALRAHLREAMGYRGGEGLFTARQRHVDALERAARHLGDAASTFAAAAPELMAEDLRLAQDALGEITGRVTTEDLLGAIFSTFCIGK